MLREVDKINAFCSGLVKILVGFGNGGYLVEEWVLMLLWF